MVPNVIFVELIERENLQPVDAASDQPPLLSLPFERRQIARQRISLDNGQNAGLKLPRGTLLRDGDLLKGEGGELALVAAAPELVSVVTCDTAQDLARAAYHLGNRHVWVQVGSGWLRYLHDHVLDEMLTGLGMTVTSERVSFEPEAGAYSASGNAGHTHEH